MEEQTNPVFQTTIENQEQSNELTARLLEVAEPGVVFSEPVQSGAYTVITASEVAVGLGSGFGFGSGSYEPREGETISVEIETVDGGGGGGGGGGYSSGRPVAVISIGPDGVRVEPVLDRTKLGIALITAVGSMLLAIGRMKR